MIWAPLLPTLQVRPQQESFCLVSLPPTEGDRVWLRSRGSVNSLIRGRSAVSAFPAWSAVSSFPAGKAEGAAALQGGEAQNVGRGALLCCWQRQISVLGAASLPAARSWGIAGGHFLTRNSRPKGPGEASVRGALRAGKLDSAQRKTHKKG